MRFLRLKEVMVLTALSRSSIYKFMNENRFPKSVSLGDRAVAWVESEVEDWMHERLSLRDDQPINPVTNPDTNK
ncbi:AlpA family transcriptional regulator [Moritella viscosa]|jgi:prophage regulatory protein|uniref:AlpA family transcriptional regulator n=1 Tax=Moritella viscosa TaxID=80854 RepID=UPI0009220F88|nr:AlpA family transcriptional regulator [Moritella viscosa]SGY86158.1 DNA-binding protein [Moritella viscosa]